MAMSRQRAVPPDIFTDEDLMQLPIPVRLTAIGLRLHADDHGRESTTTALLKASLYPTTEEISEEEIVEHLLLLDEAGYIGIYADGSRSYYALADWPAAQHPKASKFPPPPPETFMKTSGSPPEDVMAWEREGEGASEGGPAGVPPSPFCPVHRPNGTRRDCRHCGTARLAHEQHLRIQRAEPEGNP
ncbi:hypothetical protein [Pseudolysinimonas sp.]